MKILIKPSEIIKRGLWDKYFYYVLKGDSKLAKELVAKDEEFELNEHDGIVSGLLRQLETFNLIYRFNDYIVELLTNKSNTHEGSSYIKIDLLNLKMNEFFDKYPDYWIMNSVYQMGYNDLVEYVDNLKSVFKDLKVHQIISKKTKTKHDAYLANDIKKKLKFKHY